MEEVATRRSLKPDLVVAQVCAALNDAGARYLVIGGTACILHGYVRATAEVDILIQRTRENAERVLAGLGAIGYGFAGDWDPGEILRRPITVIGDAPAVDVFTVAWNIRYEEAVPGSLQVEVQGVVIRVMGLDDLIRSKQTGRPLDIADLEVLEEIRRLQGL